MFSSEIISKNICRKNFHTSILEGSTAVVTATSEIRTIFIVINCKEIIIKIATVAYSVTIFVRRFM
jgi:hypothetical protein